MKDLPSDLIPSWIAKRRFDFEKLKMRATSIYEAIISSFATSMRIKIQVIAVQNLMNFRDMEKFSEFNLGR